MARRSSHMVVIGAAVFLVGAGLVFVGLRTGSKSEAAPPPAATVPTPAATTGGVVAQAGTPVPIIDVALPNGTQAVAVRLEGVPGLAGYVQPGDRINVYATVKSGDAVRGLEAPYAKLVLTGVRVLDVIGAPDPAGAGQQTFLLALDEDDAEKVIFFAKFESLWATLVADDYRPGARTPGHDYESALQEVPR